MNDSTGVTRRPREAWPHAARTAAAVIAAAGLTLLAAACSSSPASTSSSHSTTAAGSTGSAAGGSTNAQEVAYSQCVRTHGVPNFPDPPSSGKFSVPSAEQLGVSTPQLQAAENACQSQQPTNTGQGAPSEALLQQQWRDMRTFAKCMRSHGVSNWPDPTSYPPEPTRGAFNLQPLGIDPNSPTIVPKINVCLAAVHVPQSQSGYIERFVGA